MLNRPPAVPRHVAIIMDGNGRWAARRGLPRSAGHKAGIDALRRAVQAAADFGIEYLTIYSFSTENWSRPEDRSVVSAGSAAPFHPPGRGRAASLWRADPL